MLQPGVGLDGGPAAVPIVIQELLARRDVAGGDEDEVRHAVDVMQFGLAVPTFTVIDQSSQAICLSSCIHAGGEGGQQRIIRLIKRLLNPARVTRALNSGRMSIYGHAFWENNSTKKKKSQEPGEAPGGVAQAGGGRRQECKGSLWRLRKQLWSSAQSRNEYKSACWE